MLGFLYLIACGVTNETLSIFAQNALREADVIAGGKRLLKNYASENSEQIVIGANAIETVKSLIERAKNEKVVILASGDGLYNGIGGTVERLGAPENYQVIPGCTAFQHLYAKLGTSWEDAQLFSIHGKNGLIPAGKILSSSKAVVYCDTKCSASQLAKRLIELHPESTERQGVIGDQLGMEDEQIISGTLKELSNKSCSGLSMLLLKPAKHYPPLPLGLPDVTYEHENNMITHPEVRAIVLAKLRLAPGIMWDLGAGSGSVGIEAAGLVDKLEVYAVEQKESRFEHIVNNAKSAGLSNHQQRHGNILEHIDILSAPDKVFIGGGGKNLSEIVTLAMQRLNPGGTLVVTAVTLESIATMGTFVKDGNWQMITVNISRSCKIACSNMLKAENPISIFTYNK